jgi:hypothetical protein
MMRERQSAADPLGPAASRVMPCRQSHYGLCVMCLAADAIFEGECFYCALDRLTSVNRRAVTS